ncbi:WhiB family transcriptional regulator [Streptomyces sp. NPDC001205]
MNSGRPVAPAASAANKPCTLLPKLFFEARHEAQARNACRRCPALIVCLRTESQLDDSTDLWGVLGGLTAVQRRALPVEEMLGNHPDLPAAWSLTRSRWQYRLRRLMASETSLAVVRDRLEQDHGVKVSVVTVAVAVWWLGGQMRTVTLPEGQGRRRIQLLREAYGGLLLKLQAQGVPHVDMAAYLGISQSQVQRLMQRLNRETPVSAEVLGETVGLAA